MSFESVWAGIFIFTSWIGLGLIVPICLTSMGTFKAIAISIPFFLFGHYLTFAITRLLTENITS